MLGPGRASIFVATSDDLRHVLRVQEPGRGVANLVVAGLFEPPLHLRPSGLAELPGDQKQHQISHRPACVLVDGRELGNTLGKPDHGASRGLSSDRRRSQRQR